jgi:hypothetical protein
MRSKIRNRITFANVISLMALFVALGGSVYAAGTLSGREIKKRSLPGNRIVPNTIKGKQVRESALGQVPRAGVANAAFSTFHDAGIDIPDAFGTIGTLSVDTPGNYVIDAKLVAFDSTAGNIITGNCTLTAGGDVDTTDFDVLGDPSDDRETVVLRLAHTFDAPGAVVLACQDNIGAETAQALNTRITAVQVRSLTNTEF